MPPSPRDKGKRIPHYREDTEAFRQAFGGSWSWEPRPMLVYEDGRTIAASMSGMPHGGFNSYDNRNPQQAKSQY